MRVIIAGGTGFVGRHLSASLVNDGHEVVALSRAPGKAEPQAGVRFVEWDARAAEGGWVEQLRGASGVVNLAGVSLGSGRWTKRRMAEILSSRLEATRAIVDALARTPAADRPRVLVSASGIDYYGDRGEEAITEDSLPGRSFLAGVCEQWEAAARRAEPLGIRVVLMRTALAFSRTAPAFRLMVLPFRLFAGGPLGDGRQWFTWIHIDDLVSLYRFALEQDAVSGPLNAVAPDIRPQRQVAVEIGRAMHRPSIMPTPAALLRLALGDQSQLLLHGRRATPQKALQLGYHFRYPTLPDALAQAR
ncbi:MAG: TIGR01777 family oxidoreductase [Candidatus Dormibacteraeota bacterium]|nr:TIGR01777 family oxidoreductase [Candidatus Dormibacteraeota bacterium]